MHNPEIDAQFPDSKNAQRISRLRKFLNCTEHLHDFAWKLHQLLRFEVYQSECYIQYRSRKYSPLNCLLLLDYPFIHHLRFAPGHGPIWMDDVMCQGNEYFIQDCQHPGFGENNCVHTEDAGVVCQCKWPPSLSLSNRECTEEQHGGRNIFKGNNLLAVCSSIGLSVCCLFQGTLQVSVHLSVPVHLCTCLSVCAPLPHIHPLSPIPPTLTLP